MKWSEQLKKWESGEILKYPKSIKKAFFWETTAITKTLDTEYKEKFIEDNFLEKMRQNKSSFKEKFQKTKQKNVISFLNLSKKSLLVVPIPKQGKSYTTLKKFIDNAPIEQQKKFWKKVANSVHKMLKTNDKVWVSTHGTGVPYLHVRIDSYPKYYLTKQFT